MQKNIVKVYRGLPGQGDMFATNAKGRIGPN
jgi:hypothetical protein